MKTTPNSRAFSLVELSFVIAVVAFLAIGYSRSVLSSTKNWLGARNKIFAEAFGAELLETFRSMTGSELVSYLKTNPFDETKNPYPLCSHINILDRSSSGTTPFILNPDPNVDMGPTVLDAGASNLLANRFYLVEVIDVSVNPPVIKSQYCDETAATYVYDPSAKPNERFLVTVGVSWVPKGGSATTPERLALSTVIPQ